jgi:hypothetical protein
LAKCTGITRSGVRCKGRAIDSSGYCHAHHPDRAEQRKRAASKGGKRGGRGRPMAELHSIRDRIETLVEDVLKGRVDKGRAAVAGQLYNTLIRAVSVELKAKEVEEIAKEVEDIKDMLEAKRNQRRDYGW